MLVLDARFDHIQQILSNVEIIGSLVQCSLISAIDVRVASWVPKAACRLASRTIARRRELRRTICALLSAPRDRHGIALGPAEATARHGANARSNSGR